MNRKYIVLILTLAFFADAAATAVEFEFQYGSGDMYRIQSWVNEDIFLNGEYSHTADIFNRIAISVTEVDGDRAYHVGTFVTSEQSRFEDVPLLNWGEEYQSEFWRDGRGLYEIGAEYFMPIVRNVPVFPEGDTAPGTEWTFRGEEVHDLRQAYGIQDAYRFPIDVRYAYAGPVTKDGRPYEKVLVDYAVYYRPTQRYPFANFYPTRITGYSSQVLYWNPREGRVDLYEEEFEFVFRLSTGDEVEYRGTAGAQVVEAVTMNRQAVADDVQERVDDLADTEVRVDERGVTISLENIQFLPESAELLASEAAKLDQIARILADYPDRDIVVTGHTALAGTAEGRQILSVERARAVAAYLISKGVRVPEQVIIAGKGATEPVADNGTAAGRRRNRRVEITILEN